MTIEERINKAIQKKCLIMVAYKTNKEDEYEAHIRVPYWIEKSTNTLLCKKLDDYNGRFIRLKLDQISKVWEWHRKTVQ